MKSLDEVIKTLEDAIDATDADCPMMTLFEGDATDVLHCLKEYQSVKAVLEFKKRQYEEMIEKVMKQGQEREACCQAEITRYQEAVKNCEEAENKYKKLLREFESFRQDYEALKLYWAESQDNPPLTWDELKAMAGKPVWVEILSKTLPLESSWGIATGGSYKTWQGVESWTLVRPGAVYSLPVAQYGKTWQAFRKERR